MTPRWRTGLGGSARVLVRRAILISVVAFGLGACSREVPAPSQPPHRGHDGAHHRAATGGPERRASGEEERTASQVLEWIGIRLDRPLVMVCGLIMLVVELTAVALLARRLEEAHLASVALVVMGPSLALLARPPR